MKRIIEKCRENAKFLTENYKDGKVIHPYNEEFKAKNRERAKNHYHTKGKEMKSNQYQENKEFVKV